MRINSGYFLANVFAVSKVLSSEPLSDITTSYFFLEKSGFFKEDKLAFNQNGAF